jgi:outer membrane murein-binding lipoprotein Lpp
MVRQKSNDAQGALLDGTPSGAPASTPSYGGHDHSFTLQAIMEMHKCVGNLQASTDNLTTSIQELSKRVDGMNEKLSGVTHKMYAAGVVLAILVAIGGFIVSKSWDLMVSQITISSQTQKK